MPEKKVEVKTFAVSYICDKCGEGQMVFTGEMKPSKPPTFVYKCDKCGEKKNSKQSYPRVEYEAMEKEG